VANTRPVKVSKGSARSPEDSTDQETSAEAKSGRRSFLTRVGHVVLGACGLTAAAGALRLAVPDFGDGQNQRIPLGSFADFKMNTLTWVRKKDLFVMRDEAGVGVFSAKCTHLGCTVQRTAEGFLCPCHGALYDALGQVVKGPARDPLPWFRVWIESDGRFFADPSQILDTPGTTPVDLPGEGLR
jgi:Rieske Fe-S protein